MTDYTLKNGYTFLALSGGHYGGWAKALDPVTAIKNAVKEYGANTPRTPDPERGIAVRVLYGPSDTLNPREFDGFEYEATPKGRPTPIGLFFCKGRIIDLKFEVDCETIRPMKKGDINPDHPDHKEWMNRTFNDIEEDVSRWMKESAENDLRELVDELNDH